MKSNTRLDSAVFHLTPTRTRCDLFIISDGKKEKVASGLLNPFLPHLKTARDQIEKGGYSITLEPEQEDADWFTKATVERFVRFVSTPEILERVITVESEILQIQEAIALQGSCDAVQNHVEDQEVKYSKVIEGSRTNLVPDDEKAIVLYKPEAQEAKPNGQCSQEGNSKAQLLKVLETRKNVLRKEQGMAFARAMAAGFDVDQMAPLVSFAESFGASRLKDACFRFVELWRKKHETGQWLEIEASEALSGRPDFTAMNASGIVFSGDVHKQNDSTENSEKSTVDLNPGERTSQNNQSSNGQQEYFQGQFPHAMYPSWPMHTSPGSVPMFPPYPVQGMPYYQPYPGSVPYYQPPYPHMEGPRLSPSPTTLQKRHSMGASDMETWELDTSKSRTPDAGELEKEVSESWQSRKRSGRSGKKQSGMVVIRNINYITSDKKNSADSGSESASTETDTDGEDQADEVVKNSLKTPKSSKRKGSHSMAKGEANYDNEDNMYAKGTDNWQAFQSFLLKSADEESHAAKEGMFGMENGGKTKRRQNNGGDDPLALAGLDSNGVHDRRLSSMHEVNGSTSRLRRGSNDEVMLSGGYNGTRETGDGINLHVSETKGRRLVSREDEFMIGNREDYSELNSSLDPLSVDRIRRANALKDGESFRGTEDESFIVPFRSMSLNGAVEGRAVINMDSEISSAKPVNTSGGMGRQVYEPEDVSMIPERGTEKNSAGYDLALDYEMHAGLDKGTKGVNAKGNSKKSVNGRSMKGTSDALDKKKAGGPIRKGKPSKTSPLEDAKARADKIRAFKSDVQKMKKEKEEADLKRLEAVKLERQRRIAARCGPTSSGSTASLSQTKKVPLKPSPISYGSKFSDSEPGSSSPLQRSKVRTSVGSNASQKAPRSSKSIEGTPLPGNRLTRSVSSLSDQRKGGSAVIVTPDSKVSAARIRRLSEPKTVGNHTASSMKVQSAKPVSKLKSSDRPDSKKISAIINLDKSKTAALPVLKLKTPKEQSNAINNNLLLGKNTMKNNEVNHSASCGPSEPFVEIPKSSNDSEIDDNPIVEKKIVVLENDKPSVIVNVSGEKLGQNPLIGNHDNSMLKPVEEVSQSATVPGPPSVVDKSPMLGQFEKYPNISKVKPSQVEESSSKSTDNQSAGKKLYEAPYARNSSLEDPSTRNSNHGKAPPSTSSTGLTPAAKLYVANERIPQVEYIPESLAQIQVKESPKGFKRLLMFGKKSHTSAPADQSNESDKASVGSGPPDNATTNSSNEVYTLKNLITEDETQSSGTSQKSSRHFSLLSPFRSKSSEKKLTT